MGIEHVARERKLFANVQYAVPLAFALAIAAPVGVLALPDSARDFGCSRPIVIAASHDLNFRKNESGFAVDLFAEIARRTGCQFDFVDTLLSENERALDDGKADVIPLVSTTPQLERYARFIPFLEPKFLMIVRQDSDFRTMSLDQIIADGRSRVAIVKGQNFANYFHHRIRLLRVSNRIVEVAGAPDLLEALRGHQANAVIVASVVYQLFSTELERRTMFRVVDTSNSGAVPVGISLSRKTFNAQQVDNWYRTIEAMILDSTMLNLVEKYLPPRLANAVVRK